MLLPQDSPRMYGAQLQLLRRRLISLLEQAVSLSRARVWIARVLSRFWTPVSVYRPMASLDLEEKKQLELHCEQLRNAMEECSRPARLAGLYLGQTCGTLEPDLSATQAAFLKGRERDIVTVVLLSNWPSMALCLP